MTDRKQVKEKECVMDCYATRDLSDFIKNLQELHSEGWETVEIDKENYPYDNNDYYYLKVSKTRLENDEEYNKRIDEENEWKENRKREYEQLKKEFGE